MALLLLFAFVAGAGTAVSPCVLPVLPALLSVSAAGGRRRPLGVVLGLAITFTFATVALASLVKGVGVSGGLARTLAVMVLLAAGASLLVPGVAERLEAPLARLGRLGPRSRGTGFWSGIGVGGALGFVYAPCAGPILAAVVAVSASRGTSATLVLVALAYALGSSAVLLALALGGRRLLDRVRRAGRGPAVQRGLGVVLLLTAVAMLIQLDVRFETALARHVPAFLVDPTRGLESSGAVSRRLADLRGRGRFDSAGSARVASPATVASAAPAGVKTPALPDLGPAPDFMRTGHWFNTPGSRPLSMAGLRGRVVLVDFWTYTCINCLRTLPFVRALDERYRSSGLTVVGVHTPEFSFERNTQNVGEAIARNGLRYPVAQDNGYGTWDAYGNQYWPAEYLSDAHGEVRHTQFGEGDYKQSEAAVRALLLEAGARTLPPPVTAHAEVPSSNLATPETYLGAAHHGERFVPAPPERGTHVYPGPGGSLRTSGFALTGRWRVSGEAATAAGAGARIDARFQAQKVYLVLSSDGGRPQPVRVLLDGRPARAGSAGRDAPGGRALVKGQRLYELVALRAPGSHRLTLDVPPGVSGYAFTFG